MGIGPLSRFRARSSRAGFFPGTRRETLRDPSEPLCCGLEGEEPRAPRGLAGGKPGGGRRAAAPDRVGVRDAERQENFQKIVLEGTERMEDQGQSIIPMLTGEVIPVMELLSSMKSHSVPEEIDDSTGSFVLPFRQVMYAPYPTTHIDVDVNTVKQMPPCHEHIYNQRRYMRSELAAFWRATSEEDVAQDTVIYTDESFTPDLQKGKKPFKSLRNLKIDLDLTAEGDLNIIMALAEKIKPGLHSFIFGRPFYTSVQERDVLMTF
ncbi:hypothetical protein CB1_001279007 [Camelus ferus]|nr:hypothetical protein CB1_001279007 [Camelus ferus]